MIYTSSNQLFIVGGTQDMNAPCKVKTIISITSGQNGKLALTYKNPMNSEHASFGCCLSKKQDFIYVAGGYKSRTELISKCEMYNIAENKWIQLPDFTI